MVRLEKIIYEQIFNNKLLNRQRVLGSPSKWFNENRHDFIKIKSYELLQTGWTGRIYRMLEPIIAKMSYQWIRDLCKQRGLAMEDVLLHQERELRRCYLFETINRQGVHPYHWLFFKRRRARYYKVERGVRGFYVPEWVKKEGEERLLVDTVENKDVWEKYVYDNYMSDMTPSVRATISPRFIPLEVFNQYGLFKTEGWDRYFLNEIYYDRVVTEEKLKLANNPWSKYDLTNEGDRKEFEAEVNRFISLYPGAICKEGEQFDFHGFYARQDLENGRNVDKYDKNLIEKIKGELKEALAERKEEKVKHHKILGSRLPHYFSSPFKRGVCIREAE